MTSFNRSLINITSAITFSLDTLTIDGITSVLQLMDVQNVPKTYFSPKTATGNSNALFKMEESFLTLKDLLIFFYYYTSREFPIQSFHRRTTDIIQLLTSIR